MTTSIARRFEAVAGLAARYARALDAAWSMRHSLVPQDRTPLERQFLPAAVEIIESPAPALPRAIILTIGAAFVLAILWAVGRIDMVAIAPGRIIAAAIEEAKTRRTSLTAEFERIAVGNKTDADKKAAQFEQELIKAQTRERQQVLVASVDGTVPQLAVHTIDEVVTPAQAQMVIAPRDYAAEVEATLENKDVGFVTVGQRAEVKVETFPFTRYGTLAGTVRFVSSDAVSDEKKGLIFQARVKLDIVMLKVGERNVNMTPGWRSQSRSRPGSAG